MTHAHNFTLETPQRRDLESAISIGRTSDCAVLFLVYSSLALDIASYIWDVELYNIPMAMGLMGATILGCKMLFSHFDKESGSSHRSHPHRHHLR